MTTSYLASKLMSLKLDKNAISRIVLERRLIAEEEQEKVDFLRHLLSKQSILQACRLCLRPGVRSIFSDGKDDLANDINVALHIVINQDDGLPQYICNECNEILNTMLQFKQTAELSQWRLTQELDMLNEMNKDSSEPLSKITKKHHGGYFDSEKDQIIRHWVCQKCRSTFSNLDDFITHDSLPNCRQVIKRHMCEVCGQSFHTLNSFKIHRLTHMDGPGEFKCSYCDYRSKQKFVIKIHERSHTGERPCKCHCGKSYPNASQLYAHKITHLPPKLPCLLCPKRYRYRSLLNHHIQSRHNKVAAPSKCKECGNEFNRRGNLLAHERKIHKRPKLRGLGIKILPDKAQ